MSFRRLCWHCLLTSIVVIRKMCQSVAIWCSYLFFGVIFYDSMKCADTHLELLRAVRTVLSSPLNPAAAKRLDTVAASCARSAGLSDVLLAVSVVCGHLDRIPCIKTRYMPLYWFLRHTFTLWTPHAKIVSAARLLYRMKPAYGVLLRACLCLSAFSRRLAPVWTRLRV